VVWAEKSGFYLKALVGLQGKTLLGLIRSRTAVGQAKEGDSAGVRGSISGRWAPGMEEKSPDPGMGGRGDSPEKERSICRQPGYGRGSGDVKNSGAVKDTGLFLCCGEKVARSK